MASQVCLCSMKEEDVVKYFKSVRPAVSNSVQRQVQAEA